MSEPESVSESSQRALSIQQLEKGKKRSISSGGCIKQRVISVSTLCNSRECESIGDNSMSVGIEDSLPSKLEISHQPLNGLDDNFLQTEHWSLSASPQRRANIIFKDFLQSSQTLGETLRLVQHLLINRDARDKEFRERKARILEQENEIILGKRAIPYEKFHHSTQKGSDLLMPPLQSEDHDDKWSFLL